MNSRNTNLIRQSLTIVPPPPSRFTLNEWCLSNIIRYRTCLDQQQLADRILTESERKGEEIAETTLMNKRDVDHKIQERIAHLEFNMSEHLKQRKLLSLEIDNLQFCNERIMDTLSSIPSNSLKISKTCLILREGRVGIDLCHDDVEQELLKEIHTIEGAQALLRRVLEQVNEQLRRCRAAIYIIDRDFENKENGLKIDQTNIHLTQNNFNLSMYHGFAPLDPADLTVEEWEQFTSKNRDDAIKEINTARTFGACVDILIKQTVADLWSQYHAVNEAFRRRIEETKEAKVKLEVQHSEVTRQINEMTRNITRLEKQLADSEKFMALAHTRLGNRAQRLGMELCRDLVEASLVEEVRELRENCCVQQKMFAEAQASLRYLLKTQIQLEEDINVKTNTLKIDEVDCMSLRQSVVYIA